MIVKEDDAYSLWCPVQGNGAPISPTRSEGAPLALPPASPNCIGSLCMAWLWVNKDQETGCCGFAHTRKGGEAD